MSQTINRMYDSHERASQAADELRNGRVDRFTDVHVVSRSSGGAAGEDVAESSADAIVASLMKGFVLKSHAKVFAEGIKRGGALVTVHAPFGTARAAIDILERHGPIESNVAEPRDDPMAWDDATPMSCALHMPVLLSDSATFSRFWNVAPISKRGGTTSSALGIPAVVDTRGPFSGTFGMSLISDKATILSSLLGLPLLTKPRAARR